MKGSKGFTLIEILVVTAVLSIIGMIIFPFFSRFQDQSLSVLNKNDLQDQAQRVMNYLAEEIREAGFLVSSRPHYADGGVFDNGAISLASSILPVNGAKNDTLTLVKARSFFPPLILTGPSSVGGTTVTLNRKPAESEINPENSLGVSGLPAVLNSIVFENHKKCYRVTDVSGTGNILTLTQGVLEPVSAGTEVLLARAYRFSVDDDDNLIYEDFEQGQEVLAPSVDGLQFSFLGPAEKFAPAGGQLEEIRGVRIHLLVRSERPEKNYKNTEEYDLANMTYGPFDDGFRRVQLERLVEVKNYALAQ